MQLIRKQQNKTQEDVALAIGIEVGQVSKYENQKNDPSPEMLVRISKFLDVSVDYLLGLVDTPKAYLQEEALTAQEKMLLETFRSKAQ